MPKHVAKHTAALFITKYAATCFVIKHDPKDAATCFVLKHAAKHEAEMTETCIPVFQGTKIGWR